MKKFINIYKPVGKTPLQTLESFRKRFKEYKNIKIGYAGRLDPMAHGVLLLLVYPETKDRKKYQDLDKEYEFECLFGIGSDTYDILGIPNIRNIATRPTDLKRLKEKIKNELIGANDFPYPPYSSKTVNGKALYWWARNNKLDKIKIPKRKIQINELSCVKTYEKEISEIRKYILNKISLVKGDFRQDKIIKSWKMLLSKTGGDKKLTIVKFKLLCSGGTYVRTICNVMGEMLKTEALAYDIKRTKIGTFKLKDSLVLS